MKTNLISP